MDLYQLSVNHDKNAHTLQGILTTDISDHFPVFYICYNDHNTHQNDDNYYMGRCFDATNIETFRDEINQVDWSHVFSEIDPRMAFTAFHNKIRDIFNLSFPKKRMKRSYHDRKSWLTPELKELIKTKNRLYVASKRKRAGDNIKEQYRTLRNKLNHRLRSSEKHYYKDQILKHKSNMRKTWEIIKLVVSKKKKSTNSANFVINNKKTNDKKVISNAFNKYFVNVGSSNYIRHNVTETFYIAPTTSQEVEKIISNFKDTASGWDYISPGILKEIRQSISLPLTHLCNISFSNGVFPNELKLAKVVPIFKHGNKELLKNYRPISVLSCLSKVFERLMYNRLISFLEKHKIISELQFGFRQGRSTCMALTEAVDMILV